MVLHKPRRLPRWQTIRSTQQHGMEQQGLCTARYIQAPTGVPATTRVVPHCPSVACASVCPAAGEFLASWSLFGRGCAGAMALKHRAAVFAPWNVPRRSAMQHGH